MEIRDRVSRGIEGEGEIFGGDVVQAEKNECALNGGLFGFSNWLARFVRRWSRRDSGGLKIFSGRERKVLIGCEPLIQFGIAGETSRENLALQFRKFELLIRDRVAGGESSSGKRNLIVPPGEIANREQSAGGELVG